MAIRMYNILPCVQTPPLALHTCWGQIEWKQLVPPGPLAEGFAETTQFHMAQVRTYYAVNNDQLLNYGIGTKHKPQQTVHYHQLLGASLT